MSQDVENSLELRRKARPAHIQRLQELQEAGRLIIAGPHPSIDSNEPGPAGFSGSLIIAEFSSLDEAEQWARQDPFVKGGVYQLVTVKPFKKVF